MNILKFNLRNVLSYVITLGVSGAVFQTFLLEYGISETTVNIYASVMQIIQLLGMMLFSARLDKIKNVISACSWSYISVLIILMFLFVLCLGVTIPYSTVVVLLFICGVLYNIFNSVHLIITMKLPYHIMDIRVYGSVMSVSGAFSGVAAVVFSAVLTWLHGNFEYFNIMTWIYTLFILLVPVVFWLSISMKRTNFVENKTEEVKSQKINIFKYKPFYILAIPNLLRGFCLGMIDIIVSVGYYENLLDVTSASILIIITNTVMIASCFIYPLFSKCIGEYRMIFISSIIMAITMPLMFVFDTTPALLVFYGIVYFFYNTVNYAVPVAVTQMVDYSVMANYSAWRLLINASGVALAGLLCTSMLDAFGGTVTMLICGCFQLISGTSYYVYMKSLIKQNHLRTVSE